MIPRTFQVDILASMIHLPRATAVPLGPNSVGAQQPGDLHPSSAAYSFNFSQQALQLEQGLIGRDTTGQVFAVRMLCQPPLLSHCPPAHPPLRVSSSSPPLSLPFLRPVRRIHAHRSVCDRSVRQNHRLKRAWRVLAQRYRRSLPLTAQLSAWRRRAQGRWHRLRSSPPLPQSGIERSSLTS